MSVYPYKCLVCGAPDLRVAGVGADTAACHLCGGLMLRQSKESRDALQQYFLDLAFRPLETTGG